MGFPWWLSVKNPGNAGDVGLIPALRSGVKGRAPGEGNGNSSSILAGEIP